MSKKIKGLPLNFEFINKILDEMKDLGNLKGVMLSYQDGRLIAENFGECSKNNEFVAMCASVLESAKGLGHNIGVNQLSSLRVVAELERKTILLVKCNKEMFLNFIFDNEFNIDAVLNKLTEYNQKILAIFK